MYYRKKTEYFSSFNGLAYILLVPVAFFERYGAKILNCDVKSYTGTFYAVR
jgi:hypothetical protein